MLDPFSPQNDLDQLRSRYDVLRLLREDPSGTSLYAVRARGGDRHFLVGMWPAGDADGGRAGALQPWQAHTMSPLEHPKLMTIHAVHHLQDGALAVAIDRRRGQTLAARMRDAQPITIEEAGRIFQDLAEALLYLHERGAVHRGVRPEAVFLDQDAGAARLAPFAVEPAVRDPRDAQQYRAPELLPCGKNGGRTPGPGTDLYALGVVGCRMLSGSVAREWASDDDGRRSREDLLAELPSDLPPPLRSAIERCLARRPRRRWHDAGELLACLQAETRPARKGAHRAGVARLRGRVQSFASALSGRSRPARSTRRRLLAVTLVAGGASFAVAGALSLPDPGPAPGPRPPSAENPAGNAFLDASKPEPGSPAPPSTTASDTGTGGPADRGAIQFLQVQHDPLAGPAAGAREPARPRGPRASRGPSPAPAPPRVVLLGEPIEP